MVALLHVTCFAQLQMALLQAAWRHATCAATTCCCDDCGAAGFSWSTMMNRGAGCIVLEVPSIRVHSNPRAVTPLLYLCIHVKCDQCAHTTAHGWCTGNDCTLPAHL